MAQPKPPESNGLAVASLVLGILSITGFSILTGIPAVITGLMGLKNPEGRGMSIAGLIMGGLSIVIAMFVVLFFVILLIVAAASGDLSQPDSPGGSDLFDSRIEQRI